jgi:hypothetical protein
MSAPENHTKGDESLGSNLGTEAQGDRSGDRPEEEILAYLFTVVSFLNIISVDMI